MNRREMLKMGAVGAIGVPLGFSLTRSTSKTAEDDVRRLDVSVYATKELLNNEGYRPLTVAQVELQYALNDAFGDREILNETYNLDLPDIDVDVSAYGVGASHNFAVEMDTQNPYDALSEWHSKVRNEKVERLGDVNLLLTHSGGSGRAQAKAAVAGANDLVKNDLNNLTVRDESGQTVHIHEVLHCLGFSENHGVVRELDYDDDGKPERQVVTPLWAGGVDNTQKNQCGEKQPDIDFALGDPEVKYAISPSECVRKASVRIPGKGWGPRGPWWEYQGLDNE